MRDVSVAIFTYNHEQYVDQCIESILGQDLSSLSLEIIVVDDASSDATWERIERYRDERLVRHLVHHDRNLGAPATYAHGMSLASGRYLVPLDGDDYAIDRRAIAQQFGLLEQHPSVGFVHTAYDFVDAGGRKLRSQLVERRSRVIPSREAFQRLLFGNVVHHSGTMIRRDHFFEVGGYEQNLMSAVDWQLWLRISLRHDVGYIALPLYAYRLHPGNLHLKWLSVADTQMAENIRVIDRSLSEAPPEMQRLRRGAHSSAYLVAATGLFVAFRTRYALRCLLSALRTDPLSWRRRQFYVALGRFFATILLGRVGYRAVCDLRDRYRASRYRATAGG